MDFIKDVATAVLCFSSIVSCVCWVKSARAKAGVIEPKDGRPGTHLEYSDGNGSIDVFETVKIQSKWNKWAAGFAAIAAVSQAILSYLPTQ